MVRVQVSVNYQVDRLRVHALGAHVGHQRSVGGLQAGIDDDQFALGADARGSVPAPDLVVLVQQFGKLPPLFDGGIRERD